MEEIVVALRETRRAAGRVPQFAVVNGQRARDADQAPAGTPELHNATGAATDVTDLRDAEIQRLLAENAQLNQRVVSLLKVLEHGQARNAPPPLPEASSDSGRNSITREVRAVLEAELRPVLDVLLRLLEVLRPAPARRESSAQAAPHHESGIIDLDASHAHE